MVMFRGKQQELSLLEKHHAEIKNRYEYELMEKRKHEDELNSEICILKEKIEFITKQTNHKREELMKSIQGLRSEQEKLMSLISSSFVEMSMVLQHLEDNVIKMIKQFKLRINQVCNDGTRSELRSSMVWKKELSTVLKKFEESRISEAKIYMNQFSCMKREVQNMMQEFRRRIVEYLKPKLPTSTLLEQRAFIAHERKRWEEETKEMKKTHEEELLLSKNMVEESKMKMKKDHNTQIKALKDEIKEKEDLLRDYMVSLNNESEKKQLNILNNSKREMIRIREETKLFLSIQLQAPDKKLKHQNDNNHKLKQIQQQVREGKECWINTKRAIGSQISDAMVTLGQAKEISLLMEQRLKVEAAIHKREVSD